MTKGTVKPILFCIQGSESFANDSHSAILSLGNTEGLSFIFATDFVRTKDVQALQHFLYIKNDTLSSTSIGNIKCKSYTVNHTNCGGATKDKRRIMVIKEGIDLIHQRNSEEDGVFKMLGSPIKRSLFHILDPSHSGRLRLPKLTTGCIYEKEDCIPVNSIQHCWIRVPTIYSNNTVYRHLSLKELLHIKDLPVSMVQYFSRKKPSNVLLHLITQAAPAKLLWETTKFYFNDDAIRQSTTASERSTKRLKIASLDSNVLSFEELLNDDNDEENKTEDMEITEDGIAMKAAKADDAEAEARVWNEILFKRCLNVPYIH